MRATSKSIGVCLVLPLIVGWAAYSAEYIYFANGGSELRDRTGTIVPSTSSWVVAIYKSGSDNDIDDYNAILAGAPDADDVQVGMLARFGTVTNGYFEATFSSAGGNSPSGYGLHEGDKIYTRIFDAVTITGAAWCAVLDDGLIAVSNFTYPTGAGWQYDPGNLNTGDWIAINPISFLMISNVVALQRSGTKLVDINYDLYATNSVTVSVAISTNGGATYDLPATHFSGSGYGAGVTAGIHKPIVWDAGADFSNNYSTMMRIKVTAVDDF